MQDFQNLKSRVKDKIHKALAWSFTLTLGIPPATKQVTITETKVVEYVCGFIDDVGFGTVERIIDWFNTNERKEALAKLILDDPDLKREFNYNDEFKPGEGLNYLAVAKAGILVFADYLHGLIFSNAPGWLVNSWDFVTGNLKLTDIVAAVWGLASTTINAVKNVGSAALNAVKAGLQFIANAVLLAIHTALAEVIKYAIYGIFELISAVSGVFDVTLNGNSIVATVNSIEKLRININADVDGLYLDLGDLELNIGSPLDPLNNGFEFETLGSNAGPHWGLGAPIAITWGLVQYAIVKYLMNMQAASVTTLTQYAQSAGYLLGVSAAGFLAQFVYYNLQSSDHKQILKDRFGSLHFGLGISLLSEVYSPSNNKVPENSKTMKGYLNIKHIGKLVQASNDLYDASKILTIIFYLIAAIASYDDISDLQTGIGSIGSNWGSSENGDVALNIMFSVYGALSGEIVHRSAKHNKNMQKPVHLHLIGFAPVLVFLALVHLAVSLLLFKVF